MKYRFYYLAMCTTILSHFVLYAPYGLKEDLYDGTIVAILIALIISSVNAYMTVYVYNTYENLNLLDINKKLLGKLFGSILSFLNIIANLTIGFFMYRGLIEIVKRFLLLSTPIWIIAATLALIFYIGLLNTDKSFLHFIGLVSILVIISAATYLWLASKTFHLYYAKAALIHSIRAPKLISVGAAGFFFTGVSHLSLFNPEFGKVSWVKTILVYIFIGTSVAVLAVFIPAGMLGPYYTQHIFLTVMSAADTIGVDLFIIERATYIILPMVFLLGASDMIIWGYVGLGLIKSAIPKKKANLVIINLIMIAFVTLSDLLQNSKDVLEYGTIGISIALAGHYLTFLILFIATKLKEGRKI